MKKNKENNENERQIYLNIVHPNGLVNTLYMPEDKARKKYGDISIDESGCAIVEVAESTQVALGKSAVLTSTDGEDADEIEEVDEPVLYDEVKASDDVGSVDEAGEPIEEEKDVEEPEGDDMR